MLSKTARVLRMLHLMQAYKSLSCPQIAAELGISVRSAERYLRDLRNAGYAIHSTPGVGIEYKGWEGERRACQKQKKQTAKA